MDTFSEQNESPSYYKVFTDIFKKNYGKLTLIAFISLFINFVGITGAIYFKILTDNIIPSNFVKNLHIISFGILILYIINAFITYLRYQLILRLSLKIDVNLMKDYFYHVLHLPMNFLIHGNLVKYYKDLWTHLRFEKHYLLQQSPYLLILLWLY